MAVMAVMAATASDQFLSLDDGGGAPPCLHKPIFPPTTILVSHFVSSNAARGLLGLTPAVCLTGTKGERTRKGGSS